MASFDRLASLRRSLQERGLDALYLRTTSNIAWATGFSHVFDSEQAHVLIVDAQNAVVHSDSRYAEALHQAAEGTPFSIDITRMTHAAFLFDLLRKHPLQKVMRIGIEDTLELREFRVLERLASESLLDVELVELSRFAESLREVKDDDELSLMKQAQAITDRAFTRICDFVAVGMTEREVQLQLDQYLFEEGAEGLAFGTIVATGAHAASPHAIPGETRFAAGDPVVMDFGARFGGYCSDMTRTVFMGEPNGEVRHAWDTLRRANEECEGMLHAGLTGAEVHQHAEEVLSEGGFAGRMGHSLGHSVGLDIHEGPNLSPLNDSPLAEGNVVTVEPGIYVPECFGMRLEDFGVVRPSGYEVFTRSTHEMVIINR